jgi:hypothetical protein
MGSQHLKVFFALLTADPELAHAANPCSINQETIRSSER